MATSWVVARASPAGFGYHASRSGPIAGLHLAGHAGLKQSLGLDRSVRWRAHLRRTFSKLSRSFFTSSAIGSCSALL